MSQNWLALYECGHARKVTRKGGNLKMKFFAPVSISNERASEFFGLAPGSRCFILTARILTARKTSPFRAGIESADMKLSLTRRLLLFNVAANSRDGSAAATSGEVAR